MRLFFIEQSIDYQRYRFGYRPMLELEPGDTVEEVYERGFLPFSGDPADRRNLFYLARGIRWPLDRFALDKGRRYDFRRFDQMSPTFHVARKTEALEALPRDWAENAFRWMRERFGEVYLSPARFDHILGKTYFNHIAWASVGNTPFAYILLSIHGNSAHYWYAFFDTLRHPAYSPGKWLMARSAQWALGQGLAYLYVGTGYGPGAAYKTRGVAGAEFFDGEGWNPDLEELRRRQLADETV